MLLHQYAFVGTTPNCYRLRCQAHPPGSDHCIVTSTTVQRFSYCLLLKVRPRTKQARQSLSPKALPLGHLCCVCWDHVSHHRDSFQTFLEVAKTIVLFYVQALPSKYSDTSCQAPLLPSLTSSCRRLTFSTQCSNAQYKRSGSLLLTLQDSEGPKRRTTHPPPNFKHQTAGW